MSAPLTPFFCFRSKNTILSDNVCVRYTVHANNTAIDSLRFNHGIMLRRHGQAWAPFDYVYLSERPVRQAVQRLYAGGTRADGRAKDGSVAVVEAADVASGGKKEVQARFYYRFSRRNAWEVAQGQLGENIPVRARRCPGSISKRPVQDVHLQRIVCVPRSVADGQTVVES